jgi:hypothetical protein
LALPGIHVNFSPATKTKNKFCKVQLNLLKLCQTALPSIQDDCCFTIKVKMSSNLSAATWHGVDQHIFQVFSQFIPIGLDTVHFWINCILDIWLVN